MQSYSTYRHNLYRELDEILALGKLAASHLHELGDDLDRWAERGCRQLAAVADDPHQGEVCLERMARRLRQICLRAGHEVTETSYRSPPESELDGSGSDTGCGYERSNEPAGLESRLTARAQQAGLRAVDHILFSSGQAAMSAAMTAMSQRAHLRGHASPHIHHIGGYFETGALLSAFSRAGFCRYTAGEPSAPLAGNSILVAEPVYHDREGRFHIWHPSLLEKDSTQPPHLIIDGTLCGPLNQAQRELQDAAQFPFFIVVRSALKLDQQGLEMANAGIVSILAPQDTAGVVAEVAKELRQIRTLTGTSLSFAANAALSFPWCLDPERGSQYAEQIFFHNACLGQSTRVGADLKEVLHPAGLGRGAEAPFVIMRLNGGDAESHRRFGQRLESTFKEKRILIDRGGSFGFRGHRYDIVTPDDGAPAFIRIALGYRKGWSYDQLIDLFRQGL